MEPSEQVGFDSYGSSVIVDNSANLQIFSEEDIFTDKIHTIVSNGVETIGEQYIIPKGIGIVSWSCTDDEGKLYTNILNYVA